MRCDHGNNNTIGLVPDGKVPDSRRWPRPAILLRRVGSCLSSGSKCVALVAAVCYQPTSTNYKTAPGVATEVPCLVTVAEPRGLACDRFSLSSDHESIQRTKKPLAVLMKPG